MRHLRRGIVSGLAVFSTGLVGWVATSLVAVMGFLYLWQCYLVLEAPGVPVVLEYLATDGKHSIQASSFRIDLPKQSAELSQVVLKANDGTVPLAAEKITVAMLPNRTKISAKGLRIEVNRGEDGSFNVKSLAPKPVPGQFAPNFVFESQDIRVTYTDRTGDFLRREVLVDKIFVGQSQGEIDGTGTLSTVGLSEVPFDVQIGPDGEYWMRFGDFEGNAVSLMPVVSRFLDKAMHREWDRVSTSQVLVKGHVEIASSPKSALDVRGSLKLGSNQVSLDQGKIAGRLDIELAGSLQRASIVASLSDGSRVAKFDGVTSMAESPSVSGMFSVKAGDRLWPVLTKLVPEGMSFRGGQADGFLTYAKGNFGAQGRGRVSSFRMQGETLDKVNARFAYSGTKLNVAVDNSVWRGSSLKGAFSTDIGTGAILGAAQVPDRSFGPLLKDLGVDWLKGQGKASFVVRGTTSKPVVDIFAQGHASVVAKDRGNVDTGPFEARIRIDGPVARLDRLTVSGPNGLVLATGEANLNTHVLNADFVAGALPMSVLNPDAAGTVFAKGNVHGTFKDPVYAAHVEGYGIEFKGQGAAQIVGDVRGDMKRLTVDSLRALSGTGGLNATGQIDWDTKIVTGNFNAKNLSLSEWLGKEFLGTVRIEGGQISGLYDDPHFAGKLSGEQLTAYGAAFDGIELLLSGSMKEVQVVDGRVRVGDGSVSGRATYSFGDQVGSVTASALALPLDRLLRPGPELAFDGKVGGNVQLQYSARGWSGAGSLSLQSFSLNETPIGAGQLDAKIEDSVVSLTGEVGSVDRFLSLDEVKVNIDDQSFDARVGAYNIRVKDLLAATKPAWNSDPLRTPDWVDTVDGAFTGTAAIAASHGSWSIGDSDLTLDNLQLAGRKAGKIVAKVTRQGSDWSVSSANWTSGDSSFDGSGTYNENGQIDVKATLNNFDLSWIKAVSPDTTLVTGRATVTVVASGDKADPTGRASVLVDQATFADNDGANVSQPLHILLDNVTFGNQRADLEGHATFAGFTGAVSANIPYSSVNTGLRSRMRDPLTATIKFDDRPLQDFREQFADVNMDKSDGKLGLAATLTGLVEDLKIDADARFDSNKLVINNLETELNNVSVQLRQKDRQSHLTARAESDRGGKFDMDVTGYLAHEFGPDFNVDAVLDDSTLLGTVHFDQFVWSQKLPGAQLPTLAKADGSFGVKGQLRTPVISGSIGLDQVVVNLPNEFVTGVAHAIAIDPQFDNVVITAGKGSKIETGVGALVVSGAGTVNGSLSEPDVNMPLGLQSGTFRLPSGRIALEPGGQILFSYTSLGGGEPVARVNLDLEGHTTVVSRTAAGQYEPYQVTISIRGNALDESNLHLTASSDPPDLSQDEILALIGQRDLIQGLAQGVLGGPGNSGVFRDVFYSFAIPNFSQNLTQGLAAGLHLDYLSVDYNPFDQVLLSAGKTIGKGLVLHATRQLQGTEFGPLRYEVKLEYRLPVADRFLSRVRLGFGFDQSVAWKLTLNWSKRF